VRFPLIFETACFSGHCLEKGREKGKKSEAQLHITVHRKPRREIFQKNSLKEGAENSLEREVESQTNGRAKIGPKKREGRRAQPAGKS